jgi:hypothetical protein
VETLHDRLLFSDESFDSTANAAPYAELYCERVADATLLPRPASDPGTFILPLVGSTM